ncbi:hypothetical protein CYMTET_33214, partial [Cymbomonas tetramitiformis]
SGGCNLMRCLCGTAFCYLCGEECPEDPVTKPLRDDADAEHEEAGRREAMELQVRAAARPVDMVGTSEHAHSLLAATCTISTSRVDSSLAADMRWQGEEAQAPQVLVQLLGPRFGAGGGGLEAPAALSGRYAHFCNCSRAEGQEEAAGCSLCHRTCRLWLDTQGSEAERMLALSAAALQAPRGRDSGVDLQVAPCQRADNHESSEHSTEIPHGQCNPHQAVPSKCVCSGGSTITPMCGKSPAPSYRCA